MNSSDDQKNQLRGAWRKNYPRDPYARSKTSSALCKIVSADPAFRNAPYVGIFAALAWEIDLKELFESRPRACLYPRVNGLQLEFFSIASWKDLKPGYSGILEPESKSPPHRWGPRDLILVPGSAFDKQGGRVGSGKGFYDRFLAAVSTPKWGICFSQQLIDGKLAQSPLDVRMDAIVSELGIERVTEH